MDTYANMERLLVCVGLCIVQDAVELWDETHLLISIGVSYSTMEKMQLSHDWEHSSFLEIGVNERHPPSELERRWMVGQSLV